MENITAYSFKDSDPIHTIDIVRSVFASMGIMAQESWKYVGTDVFSVHLVVFNSTLTVNGKGSTKELALASAYGELAERLSFLLPFRVSPFYRSFYDKIRELTKEENTALFMKLSYNEWLKTEDAQKYYTMLHDNMYRYYPNEKTYSYKDFDFRWIKREDICSNYKLAARFNQFSISGSNNIFISDSIVIPYAVLDYYYGSNGMCAGNTEEEALVQGICEIIERYIQRRILLGYCENIYDITLSCIEQCPNIERTYRLLQNCGYDLRMLECTDENIIPVVAAILVRTDGAYYVSMGCHPCIMIGAERAVTELFQGYCIDSLEGAFEKDFIVQQSAERNQSNYINLLKYGVGKYPVNFIMGRFIQKQVSASKEKLTNNYN